MPPRYIVATIIAFWVASIGYFIYRDYYPWWRTDAPPPFLIELTDEAAPLVAHWSIFRGDQKIGNLTTKMTCMKDDTIELLSDIDSMEIHLPILGFNVHYKITKLRIVQWVTRDGQLLRLRSRLQLTLGGLPALGQKFEMKATIDGRVKDGKLHAKCAMQSPFGDMEQELDPIPMQLGTVLNPMQPLAKLRVRPGQHWKMAKVDPLSEALKAAVFQQIAKGGNGTAKLGDSAPSEILARVDDEPQEWKFEDRAVMCYVIRYRSDDDQFTGSTWVSIEDGKVMRQEASGLGPILVLERTD